MEKSIGKNKRQASAMRLFTVYSGFQSHFFSYWHNRDDLISLFIPVRISVGAYLCQSLSACVSLFDHPVFYSY